MFAIQEKSASYLARESYTTHLDFFLVTVSVEVGGLVVVGDKLKRRLLKRVGTKLPFRNTRTRLDHLEATALSVFLEEKVRR